MSHTYLGLLATPALRLSFRKSFVSKAIARKLTANDMAMRALMLGTPLPRSFSPITNANKLANGNDPWLGLRAALWTLSRSGLPDDYLTELAQVDRKAICDQIKAQARAILQSKSYADLA